jgi:protein-S-isoprenylcysteine O-methyltransferase Ste14
MQIQKGIFTILLFLGYIILWYIKKKELLKSEGIEANVIFKAEKPIQKYFSFLEKVMTVSIVLIIVLHIFFYGDAVITSPLLNINYFLPDFSGLLIGLFGLALCRVAQVTIGKSWRVGIDESVKPGLVTKGIYNYIRNPTYTGLYILSIGVWMINPTALILLWVISFIIMMEFQVRCEEEYLERQYGAHYLEYFNQTKRYIPFLF